MSKYDYIIKDGRLCASGQEDAIVVYSIETWNPQYEKYYKELLSMKLDMDYAEAYLHQMFLSEGTTLIDGALINSAIQLLIKCFSGQATKGRTKLDSQKVFRKFSKEIGEEDLTAQFSSFYSARNQVIAHDQQDFRNSIMGLTVNKDKNVAEEIASLTSRTRYLYKQNRQILLRMITITKKYIDSQLEDVGKRIIDEYNASTPKPDLQYCSCPDDIPISTSW